MLETIAQLKSGSYLLLDNIMVKSQPGYTFGVYLSSKQEPDKKALVTIFSFFGFGGHGGRQHGAGSLGSQRRYTPPRVCPGEVIL